jgi:WD40 repeat protein
MNRLNLIALSFFAFVGATTATTISMAPKTCFLLRNGQLIAQDSSTSVVLYDATGESIHRFVSGYVSALALSYDQRHLLIGTSGGSLQLFDVGNGVTVWSRGPTEAHLQAVNDVSFAPNDRTFAVSDFSDQTSVFETANGSQVGSVHFPPHQTNVMSVALSNGGTTGVLIELGGQIFTFDVTSGTMRPIGIKGAWQIRCSSDGRYYACRSDNSGVKECPRVIDVRDMSVNDLGHFSYIGNIRPTSQGTFLVTAEVGGPIKNATVGQLCDPATGQVTEIWKLSTRSPERRTDFDPETMPWRLHRFSAGDKPDRSEDRCRAAHHRQQCEL